MSHFQLRFHHFFLRGTVSTDKRWRRRVQTRKSNDWCSTRAHLAQKPWSQIDTLDLWGLLPTDNWLSPYTSWGHVMSWDWEFMMRVFAWRTLVIITSAKLHFNVKPILKFTKSHRCIILSFKVLSTSLNKDFKSG